MEGFIGVLTACAPVLVALVGIIPTVIANRKKTQESIEASNKEMEKRLNKVQSTLETHIREDEYDKARNQRYRILRFYDEMCEDEMCKKRRHSESHFEDILDDIDSYEKFVDRNPGFKNSRGGVAMAAIKETYGRLKSNGGFLNGKEV